MGSTAFFFVGLKTGTEWIFQGEFVGPVGVFGVSPTSLPEGDPWKTQNSPLFRFPNALAPIIAFKRGSLKGEPPDAFRYA